jgi:hypothetical protein
MKLGTENRMKVGILAVLALVAGYLVYTNVFSAPAPGGSPPAPRETSAGQGGEPGNTPVRPSREAAPSAPPAAETAAPRAADFSRGASRGRNEEFHPVLHSKRPEDRIDPLTMDPTLRLDLLAKVQGVELAGGSRNLFQFSAAPVKPEALKGPEPRVMLKPGQQSAQAGDDPKPPGPPPPTPINLKYYGFSTARNDGRKSAFFLDGDEIWVAAEGDTVKKRYRVVRIGVNSVVMEDTESKRQQSLPLTEEQPG